VRAGQLLPGRPRRRLRPHPARRAHRRTRFAQWRGAARRRRASSTRCQVTWSSAVPASVAPPPASWCALHLRPRLCPQTARRVRRRTRFAQWRRAARRRQAARTRCPVTWPSLPASVAPPPASWRAHCPARRRALHLRPRLRPQTARRARRRTRFAQWRGAARRGQAAGTRCPVTWSSVQASAAPPPASWSASGTGDPQRRYFLSATWAQGGPDPFPRTSARCAPWLATRALDGSCSETAAVMYRTSRCLAPLARNQTVRTRAD